MPKFGELLPTDVWAAAARTLTDISAEEIFDLPEIDSNYPAAALASSGTANTFGLWYQLVADVGTGKRIIGITVVRAGPNNDVIVCEVEIGEGASGSEAAITRAGAAIQWIGSLGGATTFYIPLWRSLTDNARVSVRVKDSLASALSYRVAIQIA